VRRKKQKSVSQEDPKKFDGYIYHYYARATLRNLLICPFGKISYQRNIFSCFSTKVCMHALAFELIINAKLTTTQTLITEILTATTIYAIALYILKALKTQDFELLRQAFPKPLTKYLNILEKIIVRQKRESAHKVSPAIPSLTKKRNDDRRYLTANMC